MKSKVLAFLVMMIFTFSISLNSTTFAAAYPEFPYAATNYDEIYRPQYHFSPQGGWMNDINGVWYYNGTYHMSYQHFPHGLAWDNMHWGHATSTDMIHWVQQPIMLEPDVNVTGMCYSGSTVVDVNNTSGLKTGTNPVFVTLYTATKKGTCIAYSNDLGATWQDYSGNPVAIGAPNESTRDPKVFWYAPTSKWVCVLWENGMTFYTSTNLKSWTKVSTFNWGFECPDIFELAVDGGATKRWVLMDASSNYHIGTFNGTTFTSLGGPYLMDTCGNFYASQTFSMNNFPSNRVIQMAWMRGFGVGTTPTWTHNASFPCELKLKTLPEGVRVTRTPISEISGLYENTQHWGTQTLTSGTNLFAGKFSKRFDIEAVFNVSGATATQINFQIANRTVTYNLSNKTILGKTLNPINNQVKIRMLVDWGELELFGNDGQLSYSENFAFTPSSSSISMSANGNITLVSADYRDLKRIWSGTASPMTYVDDAAPGVTYSGTWNAVNNDGIYLNSTCHYGNNVNGYIQYTFTGTQVNWYGLKNNDLGMADVYIDNVLRGDNIDCYSTTRAVQKLFSISGLSNASHTIKVVVTGSKNGSSANTYLVHDYFTYSGSVPPNVDDADSGVSYNGTWNAINNDPIYYNSTCHVGNTTNGYFQYTFTGTQVDWYGLKNIDLGMADVFIDNVLRGDNIDCYSTTRAVQKLFSISGLANASHTIKVVVTGAKNAASSNTYLVHDYFVYSTETSSGVIFYQDIDYGGTASPVIAKGNYSSLPAGVPNDWMTSLKVPSGWTVEVYADGGFAGTKWTFTADTSWVGTDCNDKMSSFKIF